MTKPIRKLPVTLTVSVPNGNEGITLFMNFENRYLETEPRNPPIPIYKICIINFTVNYKKTPAENQLQQESLSLKN
jgi:hypothetical protein